jgi:hypothetical protein
VERINNTIEVIPRPIINVEPIALPAENPVIGPDAVALVEVLAASWAFVGLALDISILILFLLFYFFCAGCCALAELVAELLPTIEVSDTNGNVIGNLPKKIINRTTNNNNNCPPIIKIKSDVEVSITHLSMSTIL